MIAIFFSLVVVVIEQALATKELSKIKMPLKEAIEDGMPGLSAAGTNFRHEIYYTRWHRT